MSVPQSVKQQLPLLKTISDAVLLSNKQLRALLLQVDSKKLIGTLVEVLINSCLRPVIQGITRKLWEQLKKFKEVIRKLCDEKLAFTHKRQLLARNPELTRLTAKVAVHAAQ
jgi:hypothetical protein